MRDSRETQQSIAEMNKARTALLKIEISAQRRREAAAKRRDSRERHREAEAERREAERRARCEAFALGHHERLGAGSRVSELEAEVVRMVIEFL